MRFLPIHIDTQGKTILVCGGGPAAEAKLRTLVKTDAKLSLIAAHLSEEISRWVESGRITHQAETLTQDHLTGVMMVYAATESAADNKAIADTARGHGLWVNAADQKDDCDFYSPAIVDRSPIAISIGTEGTSPGLARALKADLEKRLPSSVGQLALTVQKLRRNVARKFEEISDRQRFWSNIFSGDLTERLKRSPEEISRLVESRLRDDPKQKTGFVSLVGAGPGDVGLLTLAAQQKLHSADVIIYDRLVGQDILDLARKEARYIFVGKTPGQPSIKQDEINDIIVREAGEGAQIVRLKGGDPLIFGRAEEEIAVLEAAGIPFEIIPGITSAAAAAASAGVSLTQRGHNKAVALMTGHDAKGFAEQDWVSLADPKARAAVYMGVGASRFIQGRLLLHGAENTRPVTVVENASRPDEIILQTTLGNLPQDIEKYGIKGPAILLLGYQAKSDRAVQAEQRKVS